MAATMISVWMAGSLLGLGQGCLKVSSARFIRQCHASKGKHEPNVVSDFLQTGVDGVEAFESQHVWPPADFVYIPIVRSIDSNGTPFRSV